MLNKRSQRRTTTVNWDQLALSGADDLVGKILPKAAYDILNPPPKEPLEQEIHAPHITLAGASSNTIPKGAGAHQNEGPNQHRESSGTSLASFITGLTGQEAPPKAPETLQAQITKETGLHLITDRNSADPAGLETVFSNPPTPRQKEVLDFIKTMRAETFKHTFVEVQYNHERDHKRLTNDGRNYMAKRDIALNPTAWTTYDSNNLPLFTGKELRTIYDQAAQNNIHLRQKAQMFSPGNTAHYEERTIKDAEYARALYQHDGHQAPFNFKYEWTPTDNLLEGSWQAVKESFDMQKIPLSRSTLFGTKTAVKKLSQEWLYASSLYIPFTHLNSQGKTIHAQCEDLGLNPRKMYEECPYKEGPNNHRNVVYDIEGLREKTKYADMVDYSEAIFNALALTKKAHSECGFHLPSVILQLHIRRLRRL